MQCAVYGKRTAATPVSANPAASANELQIDLCIDLIVLTGRNLH
jgi:hypothetical protein